MLQRLAMVLAVGALALGACSSKPSSTSYAVQVDAKSDALNLEATAYFPDTLSAHPGDSVKFTSVFRGEPHTVTFGTLVNDDLANSTQNGPPPASDAKLPNLLPEGPGDANQAAGQPCFIATGDPPASAACSKDQQTQPAFDGKQTYYNSGYLADGETFNLTLSDTIAPGQYKWMCLLHRQGMTGTLTVVASDKKADTAAEVTSRGSKQIQDTVSKLQPDVTAAEAKTGTQVAAGVVDQAVQNALASQFAPKDVSVPAGGTVTWTVFGPHTVSFNAPESANNALSKAPDGSVHLNVAAVAPNNSSPAPGGFNGPTKPTTFDGGAFDGQGFHSTGVMISFPPNLITYTLKFTTAGTYTYKCLIHPDMEGSIKVG